MGPDRKRSPYSHCDVRATFPLHALAYAESTSLRARGGMQLTNNLYTVRKGFTQPVGETSDDAGRLIGRSELSIDAPSNALMIHQDGGGLSTELSADPAREANAFAASQSASMFVLIYVKLSKVSLSYADTTTCRK